MTWLMQAYAPEGVDVKDVLEMLEVLEDLDVLEKLVFSRK